jgi:hypothetical protein
MDLTLKINTIMKKIHLRSMLILAFSAVFLSCESDDNSESMGRFDSLDVSTLTATAETGQWSVATFVDEDDDDDDDDSRVETADFNGFAFQFNADGSLLVTKDDLEVTGTWRVYLDDDSDDDSNDDELEFEITLITTNYALQELVDDWDVLEYSDNRIHLVDYDDDDNGNRIEEEVLIFERI